MIDNRAMDSGENTGLIPDTYYRLERVIYIGQMQSITGSQSNSLELRNVKILFQNFTAF